MRLKLDQASFFMIDLEQQKFGSCEKMKISKQRNAKIEESIKYKEAR
jgi:hypothetical protein